MANYNFVPNTLKPLTRSRFPQDIRIFDIETTDWLDNPDDHDPETVKSYHDRPIIPFLVISYDGENTKHYDGKNCMRDFLRDYLVKSNRSKLCYAHNGGKFDILALYQTFMDNPEFYENYYYKPILQGSRIMSFKIVDKNKNFWEFRDSFSLLPQSLKRLCQSFKPRVSKLKRPTTTYNQDKENWIKYCSYDCWSLYDILQQFIQTIKDINGSIGYTIASTSLATFRRQFLKEKLECYHSYNKHFRKAYYGGRTEIFNMYARETGDDYYVYDINSLYPYVMRNWEYPISRPSRTKYSHIKEIDGKCGIMDVTVKAPKNLDIPILPYHREDGKLLFPLGIWRGMYEYSLIEKARKHGYKFKIHYAWQFTSKPLFKAFVDHFYHLKSKSSGAKQIIYKFLLNTNYGKWGENPERTELITDPNVSFAGLLPYDTHFGYALKKYVNHSAYHLPAISIRVTALAQLTLYKFIEMIQEKGGTIFYCDTDSLITDIELPTSDKLGDIKLETTFTKGIFIAPKTYILETDKLNTADGTLDFKIKMKGFSPLIKINLMDFRLWEKALMNHVFTPFQERRIRPASLKEIRVRHLKGFVTIVEQKRIQTGYDKRKINPDYTTEPLVISS